MILGALQGARSKAAILFGFVWVSVAERRRNCPPKYIEIVTLLAINPFISTALSTSAAEAAPAEQLKATASQRSAPGRGAIGRTNDAIERCDRAHARAPFHLSLT